MTSESERLQEAARAFNRGRLRLASTGAFATTALLGVGLALGSDSKAWWFGAALLVFASASLYMGRSAGRAVLPAFVIGLIPFTALLCVQWFGGHQCHPGGCAPMCLPTCGVSGLIAGGLLAYVAVRTRATLGFLAAGATMVWLVGALGCPCIGVWSVLGMAAGIGLPALAVLPKLARKPGFQG